MGRQTKFSWYAWIQSQDVSMAAVKFQTRIQNHLSFGLSRAHLRGQLHCQARVWLCNLKKDIPLFNLPKVMGIGQASCLQQENGDNKIICFFGVVIWSSGNSDASYFEWCYDVVVTLVIIGHNSTVWSRLPQTFSAQWLPTRNQIS